MRLAPLQILFGRFEKFDRQARCSEHDPQARPQRVIAVDNSNYSSVIGHGILPTILPTPVTGLALPVVQGKACGDTINFDCLRFDLHWGLL
jgi:hypothetical protein